MYINLMLLREKFLRLFYKEKKKAKLTSRNNLQIEEKKHKATSPIANGHNDLIKDKLKMSRKHITLSF